MADWYLEKERKMQKQIAENIFFTVTCVSVFTCVIRSDYNFAMGLLSYYMIKNLGNKSESEFKKVARTVSLNDSIPTSLSASLSSHF